MIEEQFILTQPLISLINPLLYPIFFLLGFVTSAKVLGVLDLYKIQDSFQARLFEIDHTKGVSFLFAQIN
jgi:hypothetical protein